MRQKDKAAGRFSNLNDKSPNVELFTGSKTTLAKNNLDVEFPTGSMVAQTSQQNSTRKLGVLSKRKTQVAQKGQTFE